jgi:elongation factor Ts
MAEMATITASDVNKLRQQTGAGMMDCKNALVEASGDFEQAVDILRKKGQKVAAKRGDREANEGAVIAKTTADGKKAVVIMLNCETDFVAKNENFVAFAEEILNVAADKTPANVAELKALTLADGRTVLDHITDNIGKIGEKIDLGAYEIVNGEQAVAYIHPGNRLATIVSLNKSGENIEDAGKQVAMQVAAMDPVAVDETSVTQETIDRELEIGKELARQEGKPEEMIDKIAQGKLKKFFKENTLVNQDFIRDNKKTVAQFLKDTADGLQVVEFKRVTLG